jgi:hypothetical protein
MASRENFALGTPLAFYPGGNVSGAYLTLTQSPCNDPWRKGLCCALPHESARKEARTPRTPVCANWTGAHLISRGCILYGTITVEMAMRMPRGTLGALTKSAAHAQTLTAFAHAHAPSACPATSAMWDAGTYIHGGKPDPTWHASPPQHPRASIIMRALTLFSFISSSQE